MQYSYVKPLSLHLVSFMHASFNCWQMPAYMMNVALLQMLHIDDVKMNYHGKNDWYFYTEMCDGPDVYGA